MPRFQEQIGLTESNLVAHTSELQRASGAGLTDGEIVETLANVVLNIFMNYLDNIARPVVDFPQVQPDAN